MTSDIVLTSDRTYYLTSDLNLGMRNVEIWAASFRPKPYPADDTEKRTKKLRRAMKRLGMVWHGQ